jgi:hypothetical protein
MRAPRRAGRRRLTTVAGASLLATIALSGTTASAATDDVPDVKVKIRSVTLDGYTGNVVVVARVRCTQTVEGVGAASWGATAVQDLRARASAAIPCDGDRRRAVLQLDPKRGRFHAGTINMSVEQVAIGSTSAEVQSSSFTTRI